MQTFTKQPENISGSSTSKHYTCQYYQGKESFCGLLKGN